VCTTLAFLEKWHREDGTFFLVSTPDRVGAIQTRHRLLRWRKGVHEETTCLFVEWWVLSEYNSLDHFEVGSGINGVRSGMKGEGSRIKIV